MGETLGYLTEEIGRRYPDVKLLIIYYHPAFLTAKEPHGAPYWHPLQNRSLPHFLRHHLADLDVLGFSLLSWPGSDRIFPEVSRFCSGEVGRFIRERTGSLTTTGGFGRRWIKNAFQNFLGLPRLLPLRLPRAFPPLVIAASGPSLGESLDLLKSWRRKFTLWALPSALEALTSKDLSPDLIIQTDPGYYASLHLRPLEGASLPLAMPLTSARGLWRSTGPVHLFSQGSLVEKAIADVAGMDIPTVAATGTVAAAALLLAKQGSPPWIIFAGLDLCSRDILTHTRPHSFESLFVRNQDRKTPYLGVLYRSTMAKGKPIPGGRQSLPLQTYADWLERTCRIFPQPIYRLNPSSIDIESMHSLDPHAFKNLLNGLPQQAPFRVQTGQYDSPFDRSQVVSRIFTAWKKLLSRQKPPPPKIPGAPLFSCPQVEELVSSLSMADLLEFLRGDFSAETEGFTAHFNRLLDKTGETLFAMERDLNLR